MIMKQWRYIKDQNTGDDKLKTIIENRIYTIKNHRKRDYELFANIELKKNIKINR